jgi:hypothetical protein
MAVPLVRVLPAVEERVRLIASMTLENSLGDYLAAAWRSKPDRVGLLGMRLGWLGQPPRTLQECGDRSGITRERVRQLEKRMRDALPQYPVFLPRLDDALAALEAAAPLDAGVAERILIQKGICKQPFSIDSVLAAASFFGRQTPASITKFKGRRCLSNTASAAATGGFLRKARAVAIANSVASIHQLIDHMRVAGVEDGRLCEEPLDEAWVRKTLHAWPAFPFVNDDWFSFRDIPRCRRRVKRLVDRMLAVTPRLLMEDVHEGVRRWMTYRNKYDPGPIQLVVPPPDVLEAYLQSHPDYLVRAGYVEATVPRRFADELPDSERGMFEVFEEAGGGLLDRQSLMKACMRKGIKKNTVCVYIACSPIFDKAGVGLWKLRGRAVDAAMVQPVRRRELGRTCKSRCIHFAWTDHGTLSVAWILPVRCSPVGLAIPAAFSTYINGRRFAARDRTTGKPCGQVVVTRKGTFRGYGRFLRNARAKVGDVLVADFDCTAARVEVEFADISTVLKGDSTEVANG